MAPGSYGGSLWEECGLLSAESWRFSAAVGGSTASAIWRAAGGPQHVACRVNEVAQQQSANVFDLGARRVDLLGMTYSCNCLAAA